jgi:hypothetical protein
MPVNFGFLLRYARRTKNKEAQEMVLHTLRSMAWGGIHDQLGGGFARYSTDENWHVPHFEKMLYDNAQLAVSYLEAYQSSGEAFFSDRPGLGAQHRGRPGGLPGPAGRGWRRGARADHRRARPTGPVSR